MTVDAAEEPGEDVDLVRAEVAEGSAAVFLEPSPVDEFIHGAVTVLFERGRVNPDLLIGGDGDSVAGHGAVPLGVCVLDSAGEAVLADDLFCDEVAGIRAALVADLEEFAG
jgi:hypothetical protein